MAEIKNKILTEEEKQIFINMYENNFEEILDSEEASDSNSDENLDIESNQKFNNVPKKNINKDIINPLSSLIYKGPLHLICKINFGKPNTGELKCLMIKIWK